MLPRLVLASASPRRRELLSSLGIDFSCRPVDLDETPRPGEEAEAYVLRLARAKAGADVRPGEIVLAADTIVVLDGQLLGKPEDAARARSMLQTLSGRRHRVLTGVAVHPSEKPVAAEVCVSEVTIAPLSEEEIAWYVDTGEPLDKAGAYAIQGLGALLVETISGNYSNIVGLPLPTVKSLFNGAGFELRSFRSEAG